MSPHCYYKLKPHARGPETLVCACSPPLYWTGRKEVACFGEQPAARGNVGAQSPPLPHIAPALPSPRRLPAIMAEVMHVNNVWERSAAEESEPVNSNAGLSSSEEECQQAIQDALYGSSSDEDQQCEEVEPAQGAGRVSSQGVDPWLTARAAASDPASCGLDRAAQPGESSGRGGQRAEAAAAEALGPAAELARPAVSQVRVTGAGQRAGPPLPCCSVATEAGKIF